MVTKLEKSVERLCSKHPDYCEKQNIHLTDRQKEMIKGSYYVIQGIILGITGSEPFVFMLKRHRRNERKRNNEEQNR